MSLFIDINMGNIINQPWYLIIKDILTFLLTVAGLIIAGIGLITWKKQIKGTKEFDTVYNLNYSILKLRDAIRHVRNPAIWPDEDQKAEEYAKSKHPDIEIIKDSHLSVYEMRWEKITQAATEMESHLLAAEVLWGSEILKLIRPLNIKINELNIALQQNFRPEFRTKSIKEIHSVIYDIGDGIDNHDAFSQDINKFIKEISKYLQSKIS